MKIRKMRVFGLIIAAVSILIVIGYLHRTVSLKDTIAGTLGKSEDTYLYSIERMEADKAPSVVYLSDLNPYYEQLQKEVSGTGMKREKKELGMDLSSVLYTLRVYNDSGMISMTVNNENRLHINQNEMTYRIVSKDSELYEVLKKAYQKAG